MLVPDFDAALQTLGETDATIVPQLGCAHRQLARWRALGKTPRWVGFSMGMLVRLRELEAKHASDCAVFNEPAFRNGPCDCGASMSFHTDDETLRLHDFARRSEHL